VEKIGGVTGAGRRIRLLAATKAEPPLRESGSRE